MPLDVAITNWFVKKRGTALGIKWVFSGLSGVIGLPVIAWLTAAYGWRVTCLIGGIVMWIIGPPLVWFFIKPHRPEYYGLLPDGTDIGDKDKQDAIKAGERYAEEAGEQEFTVKEALGTWAFWLLIIGHMFHGALYPVMNIHGVAFLTDRGMDLRVAAATIAVYITASIPARFIGGFIVDRIKTSRIRFVMAGAYFLQFIGVLLFLFDQQSIVTLYVFFILYGLGMGAAFTLTPAIRARYFGRSHFGTIAGISRAFMMPVAFLGAPLAGFIFDKSGSYMTAFALFAILLGISSVVMSFAGPPKKQKRNLRD
jgi:sugar phosphate permease